MVSRRNLFAIVTILLWTTCLCDHECNSTISNSSEMILTCLSTISYEELPLYNYTTNQLANITSIVVNGLSSNTTGPFTSIPPNLCLLPNLKSVDFSNNLLQRVDPTNALQNCLTGVVDFDVSYNSITEFPSTTIYNMGNLQYLYFQHNQLLEVPGYAFRSISNIQEMDFSYNNLTAFELWATLVQNRSDFSYNQISTITNKYFYQMPAAVSSGRSRIFSLIGNPSINLTDAIYEMYNSCDEINSFLIQSNGSEPPGLSYNLLFLEFGTIRINCSCQQSYINQMLNSFLGGVPNVASLPIHNAICSNGSRFIDNTCPEGTEIVNSSVDFSKVYPRLCKVYPNEAGSIMNVTNTTIPTSNPATYPYYVTELMSPGACFFAFSTSVSARIRCTSDLSTNSTIPSSLLSSSYLSNVTKIDFASSISSLPSYLCSLPSREIDLSNQAFTTLTDGTFPCLDWFHTVRLTHNQLTSVNMSSGNFTNLSVLDLSSNRLPIIPYSALHPTPTSLRLLNLSNNSITSIDLYVYTLKNITVDLSNNPINMSSIINTQNVTFPSQNTSVTIILPSSTNSTYVFNDQTAFNAGTCTRDSVLTYRTTLQTIYSNVVLDCSCASINLKAIFEESNSAILNYFTCSNTTNAANYTSSTLASCGSSALNFSNGLCSNQSLGWIATTSGSTTNTTTSSGVVLLTNNSNANRTGLIIGLVLGLVVFLGLVGALIALILYMRGKNASNKAATANKPVSRATAMSQVPENNLLQSRVQTRNLRSVRLEPLHSNPSNAHAPAKGIPLPFDRTKYATYEHCVNFRDQLEKHHQEYYQHSPVLHPTVCSADVSNWPQLVLTCPPGTNLTELPFPTSDISVLYRITSFVARGANNTRGPFTTIPSNICWMSNLTTLDLSYNQLQDPLNIPSSVNCTIPWRTLDFSDNTLTTFPSRLFLLNRFDSVDLSNNRLTGLDLIASVLVTDIVDLRNNSITTIVNPTNFTFSSNLSSRDATLLLDGNSGIQLSDAIYEMYGACQEIVENIFLDDPVSPTPLTTSLVKLNFGSMTINCSCNQYYTIGTLNSALGGFIQGPISQLNCSNVASSFINYNCFSSTSTVNFTQVEPRLCRLDEWNVTSTSTTTTTTQTTSTSTSTSTTTSTTSTSTSTFTTTSTSTTTSQTTSTSTSTLTTTTTQTTSTSTSTTSTATTTSQTTSTSTSTTSTATTTSQTTSTSTSTTSTATTTSQTTSTSTSTTSTATTTSQTTSTSTSTTSTATTTSQTTSTSSTSTTSTATTTSQTTSTSTSTTSTATTTSQTTSTSTSTTSTATTTSQTTSTSTTTTSTATTTSQTTSTSTSTTSTATTTSQTTSTSTSTTSTATTTSQTTSTSTSTTSTATTTSQTTSTSSTSTTSTATTTSQTTSTSTSTTSTATTTSQTTSTSTSTTSTATTTSQTTSTSTTTTSTATTTSQTTSTSTSTTSTATTTSQTTSTSTSTTSTATTTSQTTSTSTSTTSTATTTSQTTSTSTSTTSTATTTSQTTSTSTSTTSTATTTSQTTSTSTTTTSTATTTSQTTSTSTSTTSTATTTSQTTSTSTTTTSTATTTSQTTSTSTTTTSTATTTSASTSTTTTSTDTSQTTTTSTSTSTSHTTSTSTTTTTTDTITSTSTSTMTTSQTTSTTTGTSTTTSQTTATTATTTTTQTTSTSTSTSAITTTGTVSTTSSTSTTSTSQTTATSTSTTTSTTQTTSATSTTSTTTTSETSTTTSTSIALPQVLPVPVQVLALLLVRPKQFPLLPAPPVQAQHLRPQAHQLHRRLRQRLLLPLQLLPTQVLPPVLQRRPPIKQPPLVLARLQAKPRLLVPLRQPQQIQRRPVQPRRLHQRAKLLPPLSRPLQVLQVLVLALLLTLPVKQPPLVLLLQLRKRRLRLLVPLRQPQPIQCRPLQPRRLHQPAKLLLSLCRLLQVLQVLVLALLLALPAKQPPLVLARLQAKPRLLLPLRQPQRIQCLPLQPHTTSTSASSSTSSTTSTTSTSTSSSTTTTTDSASTTSITSTTSLSQTTSSTSSSSSSTSTSSTTSSTSSTSSSSVTATTSTTSTSTASNLNVSTCVETFSIGNTNLLLTCSSNASMSVLPINGYSLSTLNSIRTLTVQGANGERGPLYTIPPNVCFLPNLLELNVSYNRLNRLDTSFFSSNPSCLSNLQKLNADQNLITEYPSEFLTHTPNLQRLLLPNNRLTSFDLASTVLVNTAIDLSNNQISKITNNANINISKYSNPYYTAIDLSNNSAVIDVSDALFEMYGACYEVIQAFNSSASSATPVLTISLLNIDFDTSRINCSCSQYYLERSLLSTFRSNLIPSDPLSNTKCLDGSLFYNNTNILQCSNSSATFTNSSPRLCTINQNNTGVIYVNTTDNSTSTQTYPYYLTQSSNNTYCMYTFYSNGIKAAINCVDGSNNLTEISSAILTNKYFQNISQVVVNNQNSMSQLPSYLCLLPSTRIDLSNQSFAILSKDTFPCSTYNTLQYINLTDNSISIVNLTYTNWTVFDLSSNNLTQLPYTLLNLNQSSIQSRESSSRTLDVSFNQIPQLDLFAYTYPSISINLESNSFTKTTNGYNVIKNVQRQSLRSGPVSSNVDLPSQSRFLVNDQLAQNYNTCDSRTLINLINILQYMKNDGVTVELECQCSSIYLNEYLLLYNSSDKLTNRFSCSNTSTLNETQFNSLAESDCLNNITLSSDRLCQFASRVSLAASSPSSDNGRLLAIILGSILGSIAFIALLALLICCLCRKRKKSPEKSNMTVMSRPPTGGNGSHDDYATARSLRSPPHHVTAHNSRLSPVSENLPEIGEYSLSRHEPIHIRDSIDSLQQDVFEQRERNRQLRQPPIDYDTGRSFRHLGNPSPNSSYT
ncbi:unnamed protein product [Adineta ricciae]|uniref:Uncharacterized protein n=1 Tax=Adineta ricciae TaxID=249248 RepID=A0A814WPU9_ADIRI|nr:unnamed protein product [Adineta ricciae]